MLFYKHVGAFFLPENLFCATLDIFAFTPRHKSSRELIQVGWQHALCDTFQRQSPTSVCECDIQRRSMSWESHHSPLKDQLPRWLCLSLASLPNICDSSCPMFVKTKIPRKSAILPQGCHQSSGSHCQTSYHLDQSTGSPVQGLSHGAREGETEQMTFLFRAVQLQDV